MHKSSILRMQWFVENYVKKGRVLDVGSCNNTYSYSYRNLFQDKDVEYIGLDICDGPNVDVVMEQPYVWDLLEDESFDYVISGQAFEHIEYPWLTIKEIYKKIKPGGICCIIAPNTSGEHKAPLDCYRYFADGLTALAHWAGFEVINCTVAGIPSTNVSPDWDSFDNDVCLICRKPQQGIDSAVVNKEYPVLGYERRISGLHDQKLRYKFLLKWFELKEMNRSFWTEFVKNYHFKEMYIYGYGNIGRLIDKELTQNGIHLSVVDQYVKKTASGEAIITEKEIPKDSKSMMLLTVLDSNRDLKKYLDTLYPEIQKFYVDEILEIEYMKNYFSRHKKVYLYGAGDYGKRVLNFLEKNGLQPSGFIVSDGSRKRSSFLNYPVYELREVLQEEKIGIILSISSFYEKEIEKILEEKGISYTTCDTINVYSAPYGCKYNKG